MSDLKPEAFADHTRRCWLVFGAVACTTFLMVGASYAPIGNRTVVIGLVLAAAVVNAGLVGAFLMHLLSERKTIYTVLAFTAVFFVGLMGLSIWAQFDHPKF